jgi:prepilin-type N-terminal cleavage/methylation domain-containing protein
LKNKKGFTLLEVLTAISVIAIISGPLLYLFVTSTRVGRNSYDTDKANTVAVALVEEVKASPGGWQSKGYLKEDDGEFTKYHYYDNNWEPTAEAYATFRAKTTVLEVPADGGTGGGTSPYLPQMSVSNGIRYIEFLCKRERMGATYQLTCQVTESGGKYVYTIGTDMGDPVLHARPNGIEYTSSVKIESDLPIRSIPIVVLSQDGDPVHIKFGSDNTTSSELSLFVYWDPGGEYVTISDSPSDMVSGVLSITYMQSHAETLENNKVNVSVAVERMDGSAIATYTSLVYLPA